MAKGEWISPDEMLERAKSVQLDGRDPETREDWAMIINCIAFNSDPLTAEGLCLLMATLYQMPLDQDEVIWIVRHQIASKAAMN